MASPGGWLPVGIRAATGTTTSAAHRTQARGAGATPEPRAKGSGVAEERAGGNPSEEVGREGLEGHVHKRRAESELGQNTGRTVKKDFNFIFMGGGGQVRAT